MFRIFTDWLHSLFPGYQTHLQKNTTQLGAEETYNSGHQYESIVRISSLPNEIVLILLRLFSFLQNRIVRKQNDWLTHSWKVLSTKRKRWVVFAVYITKDRYLVSVYCHSIAIQYVVILCCVDFCVDFCPNSPTTHSSLIYWPQLHVHLILIFSSKWACKYLHEARKQKVFWESEKHRSLWPYLTLNVRRLQKKKKKKR